MYWDEFDSKYGFSDGTAIPRDAQQVREVYVMLINHKAKQLGSQYRVIPYNRISHNLFVIHRVPLSFFNTVTPQQLTDGLDGLPDDITDLGDDLLDEAIEWAKEQQPETYVESTISIQWGEVNKLLVKETDEAQAEQKTEET